jgi:hypothetical protein
MTATDPRLAPLAAALHAEAPLPASIWSQPVFVGWAAAALRSLPDDWCGHGAIVRAHIRTGSAMGVEIDEQAATIATLRAALDGLVEAGEAYFEAEAAAPGWEERYDALRAVLAAAKEATE